MQILRTLVVENINLQKHFTEVTIPSKDLALTIWRHGLRIELLKFLPQN